ncbi:hypothetical protein Tco_1398512, partial [Tanacetum coccineum]
AMIGHRAMMKHQIEEKDQRKLHHHTGANPQGIGEYVWKDVMMLKATLLETRAKLLLTGGYFGYGEEVCKTCISIRTMMLGHNHSQTLAAEETLSKLVRLRSKV